MKVNQKLLNKVIITERVTNTLALINISTGAVEQEIETSRRVTIELDRHVISLYVRISDNSGKYKTDIYSDNSSLRITEITVPKMAALLYVFKEQQLKYEKIYDTLDYASLLDQSYLRREMHAQILKEEEKYTKKLLNEEVKRIAKENVDKKRPPVTSIIPTKTTLAIEE